MLLPGNPMGRVMQAVLIFEAITFGLSVPVMIMVSDVSPTLAAMAGGGVALLALITSGLMRRPIGYPLGWATQVAGILLGILTPAMYALGALFACLWITCFVLGRRLDAQRAAG